jgi:hypothetical protein
VSRGTRKDFVLLAITLIARQSTLQRRALHQFVTLAFTDYGPKPGCGQFVVVGEVASGILFLIAAISLLISRIATFDSP